MKTFSLILGFAFVLVGSSLAGSADTGLPGVGAFAYSGSSAVALASPAVVLAAR